MALVLRQHDDPKQAAVDEVREREVDEAVIASERDGGLGAVVGQRREALALAACEHDAEDLAAGHSCYSRSSERTRAARTRSKASPIWGSCLSSRPKPARPISSTRSSSSAVTVA